MRTRPRLSVVLAGPRTPTLVAVTSPNTAAEPKTVTSAPRNPVMAALAHRPFRRMFFGQFSSNIGTWMQNVTLGALANSMTRSAVFVGIVTFAQLGPMLLFSSFGGVIADRYNRRRTIVLGSTVQATLSAVLAVLSWNGHPNRWALVTVVAGIGIANSLVGPSMGALLPALVGKSDLAGAVALNSASMNGSRVLGPVLAAAAATLGTPGWAFGFNALTYGFVILAVLTTKFDGRPAAQGGGSAMARLIEGFKAARANRVVARVLALISALSLFSLVFIYQMPIIAERQLGIVGDAYYRLFAVFGAGAALAALSVGSFLRGHRVENAPMPAFIAFSVFLATFTLTENRPLAFVAMGLLGFAYFTVVTALSTLLQQEVDDSQRGRVMGLWMLGWAGLVPLGALIAGKVIELTSTSAVLLFGALVALLLAPFGRLAPLVRERHAQLEAASA